MPSDTQKDHLLTSSGFLTTRKTIHCDPVDVDEIVLGDSKDGYRQAVTDEDPEVLISEQII